MHATFMGVKTWCEGGSHGCAGGVWQSCIGRAWPLCAWDRTTWPRGRCVLSISALSVSTAEHEVKCCSSAGPCAQVELSTRTEHVCMPLFLLEA